MSYSSLARISAARLMVTAGAAPPWSGGAVDKDGAAPVPGQQRSQVGDLVIGDPRQHIGKPSPGIDVVEPSRLNQRQHDRGPLAATIGAGEQPRLSAEGNPAQLALGRIVAQADAAVVEEARED